MAIHPTGDKIKVEVFKDVHNFGGNTTGSEHGKVVEVPDTLIYFGFHSFGFDGSLANDEQLKRVHKYYKQFEGKIIFWEALQDRGRRFQEGDKEYVLLNMSDIIAYEDGETTEAYLVDDVRSGGFQI